MRLVDPTLPRYGTDFIATAKRVITRVGPVRSRSNLMILVAQGHPPATRAVVLTSWNRDMNDCE